MEGFDHSTYLYEGGIKQIVITTGAYIYCELRTKVCPTSCSQG